MYKNSNYHRIIYFKLGLPKNKKYKIKYKIRLYKLGDGYYSKKSHII